MERPQRLWLISSIRIHNTTGLFFISTNNLIKYCQSKYTNIYATHHYEDADGYKVNSTQPGSTPISNFTYEEDLNESKRRIRMLKPQYLESVSREFTNKLEGING